MGDNPGYRRISSGRCGQGEHSGYAWINTVSECVAAAHVLGLRDKTVYGGAFEIDQPHGCIYASHEYLELQGLRTSHDVECGTAADGNTYDCICRKCPSFS